MAKFNLGDVVYHKATNKKCVVSSFSGSEVWVTTEEDKNRHYFEHELMTEKDWEDKNVNAF